MYLCVMLMLLPNSNGDRTFPHQDISPPDISPPRTIPHQDNSPLTFPHRTFPHHGQFPTRTTPHGHFPTGQFHITDNSPLWTTPHYGYFPAGQFPTTDISPPDIYPPFKNLNLSMSGIADTEIWAESMTSRLS